MLRFGGLPCQLKAALAIAALLVGYGHTATQVPLVNDPNLKPQVISQASSPSLTSTTSTHTISSTDTRPSTSPTTSTTPNSTPRTCANGSLTSVTIFTFNNAINPSFTAYRSCPMGLGSLVALKTCVTGDGHSATIHRGSRATPTVVPSCFPPSNETAPLDPSRATQPPEPSDTPLRGYGVWVEPSLRWWRGIRRAFVGRADEQAESVQDEDREDGERLPAGQVVWIPRAGESGEASEMYKAFLKDEAVVLTVRCRWLRKGKRICRHWRGGARVRCVVVV